MNMQDYAREMAPEIAATLSRLWSEHKAVEELETLIKRAEAEIRDTADRLKFLELNPELDDEGLGTAMYWETYFGPEKDRFYADKERRELEQKLQTHSIARANLAGTLLQFAKQAISQLHGKKRDDAPPGTRSIAGQPLRNVIWEGRNQSEHWEEGHFSASVDVVFGALETHFPGRFADYTARKNKAFDVVDVLGWRDPAAVEADLLSLA